MLHFPLLDWLFTDGRCETSLHNRTSRWTLASSTATRQPRTQASCIALQSRGTHSCACAWSLAEIRFFYGRSKVENDRTKLIVLGQVVHALFISNFILCTSIYCNLMEENPRVELLQFCQRGGWTLFQVFLHSTAKDCPCHVYRDSMPLKQMT